MRKSILLLLICSCIMTAYGKTDSIAPDPKDVGSIEGIVAALWQSESADTPIPEKYLSK